MSPEQFLKEFGHLAETEGGERRLKELVLRLALAGRLTSGTRAPICPLSDVAKLQNGYAFKSEWFAKDGTRLLRNANVGHGVLDWSETVRLPEQKVREFDRFRLNVGEIVLSLDRPLISTGLKIAVVEERDMPCLLLQRVARFQLVPDSVTRDFLLLWLKSPLFTGAINPGRSNGVPHISTKQVEALTLPLPPLAEQKRIVEKVDQLMALCDELEAKQKQKREKAVAFNQAALNTVVHASDKAALASSWSRLQDHFGVLYELPENVKQLRQTILQLAVMGKLVRQDPEEEPAALLLSRVAASSPSHGSAKRPKPVDISLPTTELPQGWTWTNWRSLVSGIESGWSPQCEETPRSGDAWGVLKVSAVSWDRFLPDENKALPSHLQPRVEAEVRQGDFLMSRANTEALVGRSVIVVEPVSHLLMSDKLLRCYFNAAADPEYINYFNRTHWAREHYATYASGTSSSMKNISREVIGSVPVPLPPLAEQGRIVARVTELLRVCAELDAALSKHQRCGVKLMHSVVNQLIV